MKVNKKKILRGRPYATVSESNEETTKPPLPSRNSGMSSVKTRKDLRKEQRKAKKAQKHQYLLVRSGREDLVKKAAEALFGGKKKKKKKKRKNKNKQPENKISQDQKEASKDNKKAAEDDDAGSESESEDEDAKFVREAVRNKLEGRERIDLAEELKKNDSELKREMDEIRRKRLKEENEEEEKTISQLSKKLKLSKKAKIPESFRTDGLDCKCLSQHVAC